MQSTLFGTSVLVVFLSLPRLSEAQTYAVSSNATFNATIGGSSCTACTFNITPGKTLTFNNGTCDGCTFNGGTVAINNTVSFINNVTTFNNDTVLINNATTFYNASFNNDSVAVNFTLTTQNNTATFSGARLGVAADMNLNAATFSNSSRSTFSGSSKMTVNNNLIIDASSFYLHSTSSIKASGNGSIIQNGSTIVMDGTSATNLIQFDNALPINNSTFIMSGSAKIKAATITMSGSTFNASGANTIASDNNFDPTNSAVSLTGSTTVTTAYSTFTNSTLIMAGTANLTSGNTLDLKTTAGILYDNSSITTNNYTTLENNSSLIIGDGTLASTAHLYSNNALQILDNSLMRIGNGNNYLNSNSSTFHGGTTDYTINPNTISCNQGAVTGNAHSCTPKMVYGCATLNKSGALACTVLAVADINLTTTAGSKGSVDLSWSDAASSTATEYRVQRSSDSKSWTDLGTVIAGGYSAGDYTFSDPGAPSGTLYYRISRIDKDGQSLYSGVSTITIAATQASIRLYPNPATGRNFFIAAPTTGQLVVAVYTMTGQLLTQTQLKGQTQYALQLPVQVPAGSAVVIVIRTPSQGSSQTFTLLVR